MKLYGTGVSTSDRLDGMQWVKRIAARGGKDQSRFQGLVYLIHIQ